MILSIFSDFQFSGSSLRWKYLSKGAIASLFALFGKVNFAKFCQVIL